MRQLLMGCAVGFGLIAGGYAQAQDDTTLTIQPEQRTVIHDYVVKERMQPARIRERVTIGEAIPQDVELQPVPEQIYVKVPSVKRYEYFDWDGHAVFVDPDSRKVVQIVE